MLELWLWCGVSGVWWGGAGFEDVGSYCVRGSSEGWVVEKRVGWVGWKG